MSDAYGITKDNLLHVIPDILLSNENLRALATAVADALAARPEEIDTLRIYSRIDELPAELLDILAVDFKVDWWDPDYTLDEKRRTLKDSWAVHRILGTKGAVILGISSIYPGTQVEEWFEYGGQPAHFKLIVDAVHFSLDQTKHQRVLDRVGFYKNLRSHLDGVVYTITPEGAMTSYAVAAASGLSITITTEAKINGLE